MKRTFFLLALAGLIGTNDTTAQTYTSLGTDPSGDVANFSDIKSLAYRVNTTQDSIWFRIMTYNKIDSFIHGYVIGIDTNQSAADGFPWKISAADGRKFDRALYVTLDQFAPSPAWEVEMGTYTNSAALQALPHTVRLPDTSTLIFRVKLSQIDPNRKFNLLLGATVFDGEYTGITTDQLPQTDYYTINAQAPTSVQHTGWTELLSAYPNPVTNSVRWQIDPAKDKSAPMELIDNNGRLLYRTTYGTGSMDISALPAGIYLLRCGGQGTRIEKH